MTKEEEIINNVRIKIVECRDRIYGRISPTSIFVNDTSKLSLEEINKIYEETFMAIDHIVFDCFLMNTYEEI